MNKKILRLIVSGIIFLTALIIFKSLMLDMFWLEFVIFLTAYLISGADVLYKAVKNIFRGKIFDENFLMAIATIGAFVIKEFPEAVAVILFYQAGEIFQDFAVNKSRKSIADLMDIRPDYANVKMNDEIIIKSPEEINIGDIIVVKPGEKIPLDGVVLNGISMVNTSALTGESLPKDIGAGDGVLSGCININGVLTIKVVKTFGESTVSKILDLVENAAVKKSKTENFITKFAKYYTPAVVLIALLIAILPPLIFPNATFTDWTYKALTFLVVSCPCALVISIPMSFFGGIGGASRNGILIKGANYLEVLAKTDTVIFDKTGTLTKGIFKVQKIEPVGISKEELLKITAMSEYYSNHPIAISIKEAFNKKIDDKKINDAKEIAGYGVFAKIDSNDVLAGNAKLMEKFNITFTKEDSIGTVVYVSINKKYAGYILIADEIKPDSYKAIADLKAVGIRQTVMLTGDVDKAGQAVANELKIDKVYTGLLPGQKVAIIEDFINKSSGKVAFAGDGINDAPALARADIGIAMGGLGSDAAIEAADIVIMTDELSKIAVAKRIAHKTLGIAMQNAVFAILIKICVLFLSVFGLATMWMAVFADVGVAVLAILNAFRALSIKGNKKTNLKHKF